jgi:hypothetical protein
MAQTQAHSPQFPHRCSRTAHIEAVRRRGKIALVSRAHTTAARMLDLSPPAATAQVMSGRSEKLGDARRHGKRRGRYTRLTKTLLDLSPTHGCPSRYDSDSNTQCHCASVSVSSFISNPIFPINLHGFNTRLRSSPIFPCSRDFRDVVSLRV